MVRAQVRVALAEQVLGQTLGAAGQGCGARVMQASTHQGGADLHWAVDARIATSVGDPAWVAGGDNQSAHRTTTN